MQSLILKSLSYKEISPKRNPWQVSDLLLKSKNLIVGKNATGKSRIINVINNFSRFILSPSIIFSGNWEITFVSENKSELKYLLSVDDGKIISETIFIDENKKLDRNLNFSKIFSELTAQWQDISPPNDRLVLHVRRDQNEFPFLEELVRWAKSVCGLSFANSSPMLVEIPDKNYNLTSLNAVPTILDELSQEQIKKVLDKLKYIGFDVENVATALIEGMLPQYKMIQLKEKGLQFPLKQGEISQGMFRTFALLVIFEYFQSKKYIELLLIDDLGEGLDFERSSKLAQVIFEQKNSANMQIIATTNDAYLINSISLDDLILCYRLDSKVKCLNSMNTGDKFKEWKELGLNNFDLFTTNYLINK